MRQLPQGPSDWPTVAATAAWDESSAGVAAGADVNATDTQGRTAILIAAKAGRLDVVRGLIAAGADIDKQDQIRLNPLLWGSIVGDLDLVETDGRGRRRCRTADPVRRAPIHPAAEKGHLEIVRLLAEETDVNVNHTNLCGWTPMLEAIILNDGGPRSRRSCDC